MNTRLNIVSRVLAAMVAAIVMVGAALIMVPSEHWFSHRGLVLWGAIILVSAATPFIRGGSRVSPFFRWLAGFLALAFLVGGVLLLSMLIGNTREWHWVLLMTGVFLLASAFFGYAAWRGRSLR